MGKANEKNKKFLDDEPVDVTQEANFIWSIANKLRGTYMPDKYGDVIIPMTIIRRFECTLEENKNKIVKLFEKHPDYPSQKFEKEAGFSFYNTSPFNLSELCNDPDNIVENFKDYINGFSINVQNILKQLEFDAHIKKMNENGCLYTVIKAFSELDLHPEKYDSIKMGYIFENLIGRFFQNVEAGQFYTGRDIIKLLVSVLTAEGRDDIFDDHKAIYICDQAAGTGGMLTTAYSYFKHMNETAEIHLYGQEFMPVSHAVGLAEMLIKGQDATNFRLADTFKVDCFKDKKMDYVIENPPFGTPWSGKDAKEGQEKAVRDEFAKGEKSRWGAGLPSGGDSQLIFLQSALDKMDPLKGRAAIIENGSPLFTGGTSSGESQIRRYLLDEKNDKIEAIIALPIDLFYNTGIQTYIWILSNNKRKERVGKIQLIDASGIYTKLRKSLGKKRNEISPENRKEITKLYADFKENELCKIYDNKEFIYKEYSVYRPSYIDGTNEIEKDKKGNIVYDKKSKDVEIVKIDEDINEYMKREVLPHVPDAKAFFEEDLTKKKPIIKTGAEIPFTRYFYKYKEPEKSEDLLKEFEELEKEVQRNIKEI